MDNIKFCHVKYKDIKITLGASNYNFQYYTQYYKNNIILIVNRNIDAISRRKILHSVIKKYREHNSI